MKFLPSLLKFIFTFLITFVYAISISKIAWAGEYQIFGIKKDFPMTNDGSDSRRDYYVSIGTKQGIKAGTFLDVIRPIQTFNSLENKPGPEIKSIIAKLKVLSADYENCIARIEDNLSIDKKATDYFIFPKVGDKVDISLE